MDSELTSLFVGSLLASTIVPGGVEVLLYFLVDSGRHSYFSLWWIATLGNTIGGCISFGMGWLIKKGVSRYRSRSNTASRFINMFRLEDKALQRVRKWGPISLLLSWMPVIGDPLCIAAGFLRLPVGFSVACIAIGKALRYLVLLWLIYAAGV